MIPQLTQELVDALKTQAAVEAEDPTTHRTYVVSDPELFRRAKALLDQQAIAEGLGQMEAGDGQPLSEAFADIRRDIRSSES